MLELLGACKPPALRFFRDDLRNWVLPRGSSWLALGVGGAGIVDEVLGAGETGYASL